MRVRKNELSHPSDNGELRFSSSSEDQPPANQVQEAAMFKRFMLIVAIVAGICLGLSYPLMAQSKDQGIRLFEEAKALQEKARSNSDVQRAVQKYQQALAIFERAGFKQGIGVTANNLGVLFKDQGQHVKAVEYYEKSLEIARKIGDVKAEGNVLNNLGIVYANWGQYTKAQDYYEKSLEIKRKIGNVEDEGSTLNNLGIVYFKRGDYAKAVEHYEKSLDMMQKIGDVRGEGSALINLGNVYKDWGQYAKAVAYCEKGLAMYRKIGDLKNEVLCLTNLAEVYRVRNEYDRALASLHQALAIYVTVGVPADMPTDLIGNVYLDKGDLGEAEPFITVAGYRRSLGRLSILRSDYQKAKEYYEEVRQSAEINRIADWLFTSYTGLGLACEGLSDNPAAAEHFRKAIEHTEDLRAGLSSNERAEFYNVHVFGLYRTAPYEGLARVLTKMNKLLEALTVSEYTKARVFAEGLSRRAQGSAPQVPKAVLDKDSQVNDQVAALTKNLQKAYEKQNKEIIASLEPQVKEAKERLSAHVDMLRRQYPLFAATKYPQPMGLDKTALQDNEWVLAYHVTDPGIIIYLTRGKNLVKGLFKPIPRKDVDELVRKFRDPMENTEGGSTKQQLAKFDFLSGKKLADLLLADILPDLPQNAPVIVVPDDCLGVVPFEMLVLNDGGRIATDQKIPCVTGADFFGDRNPISYYQSVTALTLARTLGKQQKSGDRTLAMVDPVFSPDDARLVKAATEKRSAVLDKLSSEKLMSFKTELALEIPRLPLTTQLGESLKKADPAKTDLYEGIKAQKAVLLKNDLTPYRSCVFATHGYFGKDLPGIKEPVLILTLPNQPEGQDGFLRMSEVMGLKLSADIVALTACQSGLGRVISGEGTMGMGRAFQYAGAKSVLMSLWSVAESSSVDLVTSFFKHLSGGKNKLEALRLARDEIRKAGYDHPFFWAPFILVGEVD